MALKVGELFASFNIDSSGMSGTIQSIESSMEKLGSSMTKTGAAMSLAVTAPLTKIGKDMLDAGMSFTAQMSTVEAISGATAAEMEQLNAKALQMGSTTQFTATEAGEALEYMAMAGWKTDDMLEGLAPIMNLAAASGENLGTTSDIVTDALTAFGLGAEDAGHFSDILAVASSNANTNVSMMGETFKYVAPVAGAMGYKAEDVAVAIGLMANSGIKAGQAGTTLRSALSRLSAPTDEAQKYMTALGLSTTDSAGAVKPFNVLLKDMRQSFSKLTKAQQIQYASEIFGQEAMSGMLAIINASDEDLQKLTASIEDCDGATQRMADTVLDNAQGDMTLFKSAVEGAQVALFKLNEDAIRGVIQGATSLVARFNLTSDTTKQAALKMGIFAAAIGPAMAAMGSLVSILGGAVPMLAALVSPLGLVAAGLGVFAAAAMDQYNSMGNVLINLSRIAKKQLGKLERVFASGAKNVSKRMGLLISSLKMSISMVVPQLVSTAMTIVTSLADAIAENADGLLSIGSLVIESIAEGIAKSLPRLVSSFANVVGNLAKAFNGEEFKGMASRVVDALISGFKGVDWAAAWNALYTAGVDVLESLTHIATTTITKALTAITGINWETIVAKIKSAFTFGENWFKGLILGDALTGESTWKDVGNKVWSWIKGGFKVGADWLKGLILGDALTDKSTWKDVGDKVWSWIKSGFNAAKGWLSDLIFGAEGEDGGLSGLKDKIVSKISTALSGITAEELSVKIGDLSSIAASILDKIVNSKADFISKAGELITKLIDGMNGFTGWDAVGNGFKTVASGIVSSIVSAIGKVTGAAADVAGAIGGVLGGITLDDLTDSVASVAGVLIDGVVAGIKGLVTGAADIAGAIAEILGKINENDWGTSIGTLAANLFDSIIDGINEIVRTPDLTRFMENIGKGIFEGLTFIGDVAGAIVGYILSEEGIASIVKAGEGIAGALVQGIGQGLLGLMSGISNLLHSIFGSAINEILSWFGIERDMMVEAMNNMTFENINGEKITGKLLNSIISSNYYYSLNDRAAAYVALIEAGFEEQANQADFTPAGVALSNAIELGFLNSQPEAKAQAMAALIFSGMGDYFGQTNQELFAEGLVLVDELYSGVQAGTDVITPLLQQLGIQVPATLAESIDTSSALVQASTSAMMNSSIQAAAEELEANSSQMITDGVVSGVTTGFESSTETVQRYADSMFDTVAGVNDLATVKSNANSTGETSGQAIGSGISNQSGNVQLAIQTLVTLMNTTFQPVVQNFGLITRQAMMSAASGIMTMNATVNSAAGMAAQNAVATMRSILNHSAGYSLGNDIMQGMVDGINSMSGSLSSVAGRVVRSAVSAMRRAADAHSPSRETIALGQDMDEGGAIGLSGGLMAAAAAKATRAAVEAIAGEARIHDPSRGTVMTARQSARQTASETARGLLGGGDRTETVREIGTAMADRLIESGVMNRKLYIGKREAGEELAEPVSKEINRKSQNTVSGHRAQGVIA